MGKLTSICFLGVVAASTAVAQPGTGTLRVAATDDKGAPLAGAQIGYRRIIRNLIRAGGQVVPAKGEAVIQNRAPADANGAAAVPNLPSGDYVLCGGVPGLAYLDPCKWATPPRVTVAAAASTRFTLVLTKGIFLKVRINDPKGLLPKVKDGPLRAGNLIVGVNFRNGAFHGAENTSVDPAGRDYQMIVPAGEPLRVWLFSRDVALTDAGGQPVAGPGALIPFQAKPAIDQTFTFTVSGPATAGR